MDKKIVIAGPASQKLAVDVAKLLNATLIKTENKVFPDGECYLRLAIDDETELKGKDIIIIQTTGSNALSDQNQRIMELIMMISVARRNKAEKIRVVVPYFAYSRQDKIFRPGECSISEEILKWIENSGATEFYTVDLHSEKILDILSIPSFNLDPMKYLAQQIKDKNIENLLVICPDKGAYKRSREFAQYLGDNVPVVQFNKKRDVVTGEITMEGDIEVSGKNIVIADDQIATGGTIANAIKIAKKSGTKSIYVLSTHPLLIGNAVINIINAGAKEIIGTDSLDSIAMQVSLAPLIAESIQTK